jgi:hypothetical protein
MVLMRSKPEANLGILLRTLPASLHDTKMMALLVRVMMIKLRLSC